jgi:hypothetical protein
MSEATPPGGYATADEQRDRLVEICRRLEHSARLLGEPGTADAIAEQADQILDNAFRVMFVGDFNRGKSTLVNALLGDLVLPVKATEATAVITHVRHGDEMLARLWPTDPALTVIDVEPKDLIGRITVDTKDPDKPNPYRLAEVFWPLELCRHNVVIVDSPGLNAHETRDKITQDELRRADAVVFLQHAIAMMSTAETRFLRFSLSAHDPFFVFTRFDDIDEDERASVTAEARGRIAAVRGLDRDAEDRFYFVDAKRALRARVARDETAFADTGVGSVETALELFLSGDRHRAKMTPPAQKLRGLADELDRSVPQRRALLDASSEDLARSWEEAQDPLRRLEADSRRISEELANQTARLSERVESVLGEHLRAAAGDAVELALEVETETKLGLVPWKVKERAEAAATEVASATAHVIEERITQWAEDRLEPLVTNELTEMARHLNTRLGEFEADLEKLRIRLTGVARSATEIEGAEETPLLRFLGGVGGFAFGGLAGGVIGARFGAKEALRTILPTIAIWTAWMFTPFGLPTLVGMLAVQTLVQGQIGLGRVERTIRRKVGEEMAKQLRIKAPEMAQGAAAEFVEETMRPIETAIAAGMANRLDAVRLSVRDAKAAIDAGDAEVQRLRTATADAESILRGTVVDLAELIEELADSR